MGEENSALRLILGCFSVIGVIFTILGFIVAALAIFYQRPIYVFLDTILQTPVATAVVIPRPVTATAAPTSARAMPTQTSVSVSEQDPPSGTIVLAGQSISNGEVSITLQKSIETASYCTSEFGLTFRAKNLSQEQKFISYKPSYFLVTDNLGNRYPPAVCKTGHGQEEEYLEEIKQFTIKAGESLDLRPDVYGWHRSSNPLQIPFFQGSIPPEAEYLTITIDKLAGMENLTWRYNLR